MGTTKASKDTGLAPLACTQCRSQHLKCDGRPTCSRCAQNGMKCQYIPSRRGGRRKPATSRRPASVNEFALVSSPDLPLGDAGEDMASSAGELVAPTEMSLCGSAGPSIPGTWRDDDDRLLRLFYEHFHIAHPILVPSSRYHGRRYPIFLQLVIHFIGSHYTPSANISSQRLKEQVVTALTPDVDRSPCLVQAWLLFAIALHARGEWPEARDAFDKSLDLALDLGMNRWAFAASAQPQTPTEAESMRRTWWELYVTDIIMAIPQRNRVLRCSKVISEAGLPCEESRYGIDDGNLGPPHRLLDFKHRVFAAEETVFSSFSYRIEAATIMCQVLILNRLKDPHRDQLQAVENALVSWANHLPQSKMEFIDVLGNVDEMMFQAHTITAYSAMLLHLPRSDLSPLLPLPDDHLWPRMPRYHASPSKLLIHSIKAIEASRRLSDFISVCSNTLKHSPFLFSAMALCGMLQVATTKAHPEDCLEHHYNRVTLILGCLRSSKRTWKLAGLEYERVRLCAVEHMKRAIEKLNTNSPAGGLGDGNTSDAQIAPEFPMSADISLSTTPAGGQDGVLSDIMLGFIDPTCNNPSFFSSFTDFGPS